MVSVQVLSDGSVTIQCSQHNAMAIAASLLQSNLEDGIEVLRHLVGDPSWKSVGEGITGAYSKGQFLEYLQAHGLPTPPA